MREPIPCVICCGPTSVLNAGAVLRERQKDGTLLSRVVIKRVIQCLSATCGSRRMLEETREVRDLGETRRRSVIDALYRAKKVAASTNT